MPFRLLVVETDPAARAAMDRMLSTAGNMVTSVAEFDAAEERLVYAPPDLLITAVKLGSHNGIHLVLRAQANHPHTQAIVVHTDDDPVLEEEATSAGATYVKLPVDQTRFIALVQELLAESSLPQSSRVVRRWPRKQVKVRARVGNNDANVVDVSYGGLRLEIGTIDHPLSRLASVDIPKLGCLPVHPVWARGGGAVGRWWCGAEIDSADENAFDAWRRFVDSLD
jgi:DNA-binding response OmpR family regulator